MTTDFSFYIKDDFITLKYAKGSGAIQGREVHDRHEIIYFMGGNADFFSEKVRVTLSPDQIIIVPKGTYHQININGNESEYHRCIFSFYDISGFEELIRKSLHDVSVVDMTPALRFLFRKIIEITKGSISDAEKKIITHSVLALIMNEFSTEVSVSKNTRAPSYVTAQCIEYINSNLSDKININKIASFLNISVSTLTQAFKRDMNISVYQYILKKRLILAQQKIQMGEPSTTVAIECGFNDYSGFYRQFKKLFGTTPKGKNNNI